MIHLIKCIIFNISSSMLTNNKSDLAHEDNKVNYCLTSNLV